MGWFGPTKQMLYYLSTVGADKDGKGNFLITGAPVTVGLDPEEVAVPEATCYLVDGKPKALAAGLCSTSYGMRVNVL